MNRSLLNGLKHSTLPTWLAVIAMGVAGASTLRAADTKETAAEKRERKEQKHEREELRHMPKDARQVLERETKGATNIDYYKLAEGDKQHIYGATFTTANGESWDLRVDKNGKVLSKMHNDVASANAAAAAARAQPAGASVPATPLPATPITPAAGQTHRDPFALNLNEMPAAVQATMQQQIKKDNARDVRYYRAKLGQQDVYEIKYDTADGKEMAVRVDPTGKIVDSRQLNQGEPAQRRDNAKLQFNELPKAVQRTAEQQTRNGHDIRYYRAKLGSEDVYEAKFDTADGKLMAVRIDPSGKVVDSRQLNTTGSGSSTSTKK